MVYIFFMEIEYTDAFLTWYNKLTDPLAKKAIDARLTRILAFGHFGDIERYGLISELRIDKGKGYRIYCMMRSNVLVLLLLGGDKKSQDRDFKLAKKMAEEILREG